MGWKVTLPSTIYAIRCEQNGKVYIGRTQDIERRLREHITELRNGNKRIYNGRGYGPSDFQKDFNKYGESAFEIYILEEAVPPEVVREREAYWIAEYNATDREYGYNKNSEQPVKGFEKVKKGPPPKNGELETVYQKYDRLSPENQEVVKTMIKVLLDSQ